MKKFYSTLGINAALLIVATAGIANPADNATLNNEHTGFYVSGDIGAVLSDTVYDSGSSSNHDGSASFEGFGFGGAVGYMFNSYIGAEASIFYTPNLSAPFVTNTNVYWYGGAVKLNLPVGNNFAFFLKGGVGGLTKSFDIEFFNEPVQHVSNTNVGGILSGGMGYSFSPNSELTLECNGILVSADNNSSNSVGYITLLGVGYTYHFQ